MAYAVGRNDMHMIGWDVSAGDWGTSDPQLIARRVLAKVRPGSIIDLHDGLDGQVNADRSVLVRAMPLILDGLAARGLQVVRLDRLLGMNGYADRC
jgi:peptidoglycan/xylan/chitin deacetylase (PgdA/CDA1 family)